MSAWIVSKYHIDLLVRFAAAGTGDNFSYYHGDEWTTLGRESFGASALGQILVAENVRSVATRYPDDNVDAGELPGPVDAYYLKGYIYSDPGRTLSPGEVFKALDCYEYQSCETDDWTDSEAYSIVRAIRRATCGRVEGYEDAPWGFERAGTV